MQQAAQIPQRPYQMMPGAGPVQGFVPGPPQPMPNMPPVSYGLKIHFAFFFFFCNILIQFYVVGWNETRNDDG